MLFFREARLNLQRLAVNQPAVLRRKDAYLFVRTAHGKRERALVVVERISV